MTFVRRKTDTALEEMKYSTTFTPKRTGKYYTCTPMFVADSEKLLARSCFESAEIRLKKSS